MQRTHRNLYDKHTPRLHHPIKKLFKLLREDTLLSSKNRLYRPFLVFFAKNSVCILFF